jgi:hypothetical protein
MTFDAMAAAVDWLDAYCAADIEAILKLFAYDALVECRCAGWQPSPARKACGSTGSGNSKIIPPQIWKTFNRPLTGRPYRNDRTTAL